MLSIMSIVYVLGVLKAFWNLKFEKISFKKYIFKAFFQVLKVFLELKLDNFIKSLHKNLDNFDCFGMLSNVYFLVGVF